MSCPTSNPVSTFCLRQLRRREERKPNLNQKRQKRYFRLLPFSGAALKAVEDQLDSLICAYVGARWWYWGLDRNWVLGDLATGYIIVPLTSSVPILRV